MAAEDRQSQLSLPGVESGSVPPEAIAYLNAVRRYYQPGVTRAPTNVDIAALLELPTRTWDNRKADLRGRRWGVDYIEVWPPPPGWRPSWEYLIANGGGSAPAPGQRVVREPAFDDQMRPVTIEEMFDADGRSLWRRLVERLPSLAAILTGSVVLDIVSDGRLDGIVRFIRICLPRHLL